jgi:two-component system response regulator FlrC
MLEAMLFGHEKGAFTGAIASSPGKFEQANGGTILLDEVSEMDPGLQSKLLRVLQEREVERVGGRKTIALDVRVIATTNRNLAEHVRESRFREDLYYRLTVFPMHWQPLRERPLDILPLANAVLKNHSRKLKLNGVRFAADAREAMLTHPWPGNVRELDNAIQRALVLHQSNVIHVDDLCLDLGISARSAAPVAPIAPMVSETAKVDAESTIADAHAVDRVPPPAVPDAVGTAGAMANQQGSLGTLEGDLRQQEFRLIIQTLRQERGRRNRAAEQLGISPRTLRYKLAQIREAGIDLNAEMALV